MTTVMSARRTVVFRFDALEHRYYLDGHEIPHITGLLEQAGWIDSTWMTEESSLRGRAVHRLTAAYDLGALDVEDQQVGGQCRGYLLGYAKVMQMLRPTWASIEEPFVHAGFRFGGRPDRVGAVHCLQTILEIKSGAPAKGDAIQTALQAVLLSWFRPADAWMRRALYLQRTGKFRLIPHTDRRDLDEALRIVRVYCR